MHWMNIELRSLRHVVVLSRLLSYTKAAQELCMTQSALSRSIQTTEEQLKARLFDRDRGGVHLTTLGRTFVCQDVPDPPPKVNFAGIEDTAPVAGAPHASCLRGLSQKSWIRSV